jgi:hypothetical protein
MTYLREWESDLSKASLNPKPNLMPYRLKKGSTFSKTYLHDYLTKEKYKTIANFTDSFDFRNS